MKDSPLSLAFVLCVDLCLKRGHANIRNQLVDVAIDDTWSFRINGHPTQQDSIPAYHLSLEYNGFPAGIFGPGGGIIAAGEGANEDALIRALRKAGATTPDDAPPEPDAQLEFPEVRT